MTEVLLKLLNMSISAGWIVLAVLFIRLVFKKSPKWVNVALWGLVGVRLLLPFSIESILSLIPSTNTVPRNIIQTAAPEINSGLNSLNQAVNPLISESLAPNAAESVNPIRIITSVALVVWVLGVAAMVIYTVISYIKIYSLVKNGEGISENIIRTDNIDTPFILGIIKPKIYLPSFLSEEDSRYVIAHEKAHQKRRDYIWKPLAFALLSVYWFNPILWVGYIFLCKDIEFACDEKVISLYGEEFKVPYSKVLIKCSIPRKAITSCPVAFGEINVKDRIVKILNYKKPSFWVVAVSIVLCAVMAVCFLTDPIKKGKDKPEKEAASSSAVTSSEDTSDTASDLTETVVSDTYESKPEESKKQDTSSKDKTIDSSSTPEETKEPEKFLNENDDIGDLSLETAEKIKIDYLNSNESYKDIHPINISINKYYGTLSDGSLLLDICIPGGYPTVVVDNIWFNVVDNYAYLLESINHPNQNLLLYKNSKFYDIKDAYEKNIITKKVVDEIFKKNPQLNICNDYLNPKDNAGGLNISEIIYMKYYYRKTLFGSHNGELSYRDKYGIPQVKDFYISKYYKTFKSGYRGYFIKQSKVSDNMSETVGIYKYKHIAGDNLLLIAENPNAMTSQSFATTKYNCYNLKSAYENKIITDTELEHFFKDFPEYNGY